MRGADGFEAELLLAPPLHPDAVAGHLRRDHCGIQRGVIGAVMAVAACPVGVADGYLLPSQAENVSEALRSG